MKASAKQWTVVMTLSAALGVLTTLVGPTAHGQNLPTVQDSTQTAALGEAASTRPPVARLLTGGESATPSDAQQIMRAARKALAAGNVTAARQHLATLATTPAELGARDSAASIEAMVRRHENLMELSQAGDPDEYNRHANQFLLEQAEQLLTYGEWQAAEGLAEAAKSFGAYPNAKLTSEALLRRMAELKTLSPADLQRRLTEAPTQLAQATDGMAGQVRTADFQPESDTSRVVLASNEQVPPGAAEADDAIELYLRGIQALNTGNRALAQDLLEQAWQKRDTLDPAILATLEQRRAFLRNTIAATTVSTTGSATPKLQDAGAPIDLEAQNQIVLQKIRQHIARQRSTADQLRDQKQPRQALSVLQSLRADIEKSDLESSTKTQFVSMIDREIDSLSQFIAQHIVEIETAETNVARLNDIAQERDTKYGNEKRIQSLVEQFNQLQREQRFPEANMIARQATELDPQNPAVILMVEKGKTTERLAQQRMIKDMKEQGNYNAFTDVDMSSVIMDPNLTVEFPHSGTWDQLSQKRGKWLEEQAIGDPAEYRIRQILSTLRVTPVFQGTPLAQAMDLLGQEAGVNITFDVRGMAESGVDADAAVNFVCREPISLQSAMELILSGFDLTFVIESEVIKITGKSSAAPKLQRLQYYVGDLITPIPNFQGVNPVTIMSAGGVVTSGAAGMSGQMGPLAANNGMNPSNAMISPLQLAQQLDPDFAKYGGYRPAAAGIDPMTGQGGMMMADFTSLINLIQTTVEPLSWEDNGGPAGATITEFQNTNSLVIRNTQAVHDQIQDLLKRLRELQDVQIVIETRFISLSDSFFERIGVDFDFQLNDYSRLPLGSLADERSRSALVGRLGTPDLTFPTDFDIPFTQNSFGETVPQFGGFGDPATAANFGFAILSDIEVFFLIQAAKGDQRSNVMTAPKITLFNGQFGQVSDVVTRNFVTSVTPVVGSFAAAHAPVISVLAEGTMMSVQAVVSHDRRFVRLTLVPTFTKLNDVTEFTFSGSTTTNTGSGLFDPTDGRFLSTNREQTTAGVTVQQPVFAFTSVSATVAVPDGGTILLGGVKRLSEARVERGVPFLANLPWINRLFKNVGIGRDTSSLMLMVTPRVIIKEEEEARNVGIAP